MFPSGMIADRLDLRYFLSGGMIGSGIITILFGMGAPYFLEIHSLIYYIFIQVFIEALRTKTNYFYLSVIQWLLILHNIFFYSFYVEYSKQPVGQVLLQWLEIGLDMERRA